MSGIVVTLTAALFLQMKHITSALSLWWFLLNMSESVNHCMRRNKRESSASPKRTVVYGRRLIECELCRCSTRLQRIEMDFQYAITQLLMKICILEVWKASKMTRAASICAHPHPNFSESAAVNLRDESHGQILLHLNILRFKYLKKKRIWKSAAQKLNLILCWASLASSRQRRSEVWLKLQLYVIRWNLSHQKH